MSAPLPPIAFDNSFARDLQGLYVPWRPAQVSAARLLQFNTALAQELGLDAQALQSPDGVALLAGTAVPDTAQPLAQAYAGHQFGAYSPQLGDGRALLLGELVDRQGQRRDIALKGSGRTPFSRNGDGLAALGPVLREYLMGEAMHALGIPSTRALAALATGDTVWRERALPGAILVRVAASHLRVGTFEFFAAQDDTEALRRLTDYTLARHDPQHSKDPQRHWALLHGVARRQAQLVARWMGVGFIHGVMNTDNMALSGETLDYGPCAFMEAYDPRTVFSSIDTQGRYAFGKQPGIAQWNLARLAQALLPLDANPQAGVERANALLQGFAQEYGAQWNAVLAAKLGLDPADQDARALGDTFLGWLQEHALDYTLGFRALWHSAQGQDAALAAMGQEAWAALQPWLQRWRTAWQAQSTPVTQRLRAMQQANPAYIARNHQVEAALEAAVERDDLGPYQRLLAVLAHPFDEREADQDYARAAPAQQTACYRTYCGT
ncbi:MAG: protein adenylyltransferase SelO [Rhodoferax sp.]